MRRIYSDNRSDIQKMMYASERKNMTKEDIQNLVEDRKIVPVVKLDRAEDTKPLCRALCEGGLPVAEITFRSSSAEEAIRIAAKEFPEMLIGAGTVTNVDQAKRALAVGAKFIVTPGFSRKITEYALDQKVMIFPGVCTPTEMMEAMEYGLNVMKFFPAKQFGGIETIKAFSAPFPMMHFMPTGGINASNILDYLAVKSVIACGGSWMVKGSLINDGKFDEIARLTKEAVELVKTGRTE